MLGENGAGKSTLMHVLYGLVRARRRRDARSTARRVRFASAARRAPRRHRHGAPGVRPGRRALRRREPRAQPQPAGRLALATAPTWPPRRARLAAEVGLELGDLDAPRRRRCRSGTRQRIEIVKALAGETRVLILDEPTAVLTPAEVGAALRRARPPARAPARAVLFITHKLREVMAIADRVTVMRRGRVVARAPRARRRARPSSRELMVGALDRAARRAAAPRGRCAPAAARASTRVSRRRRPRPPALDDVDLAVRAGEIFGIAGVDGNGQAELFEVLAGAARRRRAGPHRRRRRARSPRFDPAALHRRRHRLHPARPPAPGRRRRR